MRAIKARLSKFSTVEEYVHGWGQYYYNGGILLPTRKTEAIGTRVTLNIQIASGETVLRGEGLVEDVRNNAEGTPVGMVIRFTKLDSKSKGLIETILDQKRAHRTSAAYAVSEPVEPKEQEGPELDAIADALDQTFDSIFGGLDAIAQNDMPAPGAANDGRSDESRDYAFPVEDGLAQTGELQPSRLGEVSEDAPVQSKAQPASPVAADRVDANPGLAESVPDLAEDALESADSGAIPAQGLEAAAVSAGGPEPASSPATPADPSADEKSAPEGAARNQGTAPEAAIARLKLKSVPPSQVGKPRAESEDFPEPTDLKAADVDNDLGADSPPTLSDDFRAVAERAAAESEKGERALAGLLADSGPADPAASEIAVQQPPPKGLFARIAAWFRSLFGGKS